MPTNDNECVVTISQTRFEELIRAEQTAQKLTSIIADTNEHYRTLDRDDLKLLYHLFCFRKEDDKNEELF